MSSSIIVLLLPLILVAVAALASLLGEAFIKQSSTKHIALPWIGAAFLALATLSLYPSLGNSGVEHIHNLLAFDGTRAWIDFAVIISALCGIIGLQHSLRREDHPAGEPYALMLLASVGAMIMVHAVDSIALFVGIELASLSIYAMIGLRRHRLDSGEGLLKYFVMGAVFSALYLYGAALLFGATGTTAFGAAGLADRESLLAVGYGFIFLGLLFKVGVVPFHFWSPDAYTGAPLAVTGFMASVMKLGGFTAIGVLWLSLINSQYDAPQGIFSISEATALMETAKEMPPILQKWSVAFLVLGVLSVVIGNLSALGQSSTRRIMAFSSTAHAGYMLLSLPLHELEGSSIHHLWYYLIGYAIATSAMMAAVTLISGKEDNDQLTTLAGQGRRHPFAGIAITLSLTSLAGVPLTIGFLGKYMIFGNLVREGQITVAIIGMVLAVVGAIYYFRMVMNIWQPKDAGDGQRQQTTGLAYAGIACALICIIGLLLFPDLRF